MPPFTPARTGKRHKQGPFVLDSDSDGERDKDSEGKGENGFNFDRHTMAPKLPIRHESSSRKDHNLPSSRVILERQTTTATPERQLFASAPTKVTPGNNLNMNRFRRAVLAKKQGDVATSSTTHQEWKTALQGRPMDTANVGGLLQKKSSNAAVIGGVFAKDESHQTLVLPGRLRSNQQNVRSPTTHDAGIVSQARHPGHCSQVKPPSEFLNTTNQSPNNIEAPSKAQLKSLQKPTDRAPPLRFSTQADSKPVEASQALNFFSFRKANKAPSKITSTSSSLRNGRDGMKAENCGAAKQQSNVSSEWRRTQAERSSARSMMDAQRPEIGARHEHTLTTKRASLLKAPISTRTVPAPIEVKVRQKPDVEGCSPLRASRPASQSSWTHGTNFEAIPSESAIKSADRASETSHLRLTPNAGPRRVPQSGTKGSFSAASTSAPSNGREETILHPVIRQTSEVHPVKVVCERSQRVASVSLPQTLSSGMNGIAQEVAIDMITCHNNSPKTPVTREIVRSDKLRVKQASGAVEPSLCTSGLASSNYRATSFPMAVSTSMGKDLPKHSTGVARTVPKETFKVAPALSQQPSTQSELSNVTETLGVCHGTPATHTSDMSSSDLASVECSVRPDILLPSASISPSAEPYFEYTIHQALASSWSEEIATEITARPLTSLDTASVQMERSFQNSKQQFQLLGMELTDTIGQVDDDGLSVQQSTFRCHEDPSKVLTLKLWIERAEVSVYANHVPSINFSPSTIGKIVYAVRLWKLLKTVNAEGPDGNGGHDEREEESDEDEDEDKGEDEDTDDEAARVHHFLPSVCTEIHTTLDAANRAAKRVQIYLSHKESANPMQQQWQTKNLQELNRKLEDLREEIKNNDGTEEDAPPSQLAHEQGRGKGCWRSLFKVIGGGNHDDYEVLVCKVKVSGPRNI